jgi:hypothetical protein
MTLTSFVCIENKCPNLCFRYFSQNGEKMKKSRGECSITGKEPRRMEVCPLV